MSYGYSIFYSFSLDFWYLPRQEFFHCCDLFSNHPDAPPSRPLVAHQRYCPRSPPCHHKRSQLCPFFLFYLSVPVIARSFPVTLNLFNLGDEFIESCLRTSGQSSCPFRQPRPSSHLLPSRPTSSTSTGAAASLARSVSPTATPPHTKTSSARPAGLPASTSQVLPGRNPRVPKRSATSARRALSTATPSQATGSRSVQY